MRSTILADNMKQRATEVALRHRRSELPCGNDPTAAPLEVELLTLAQARAILADPMRDMRYLEARLGPDIQEYLRWKRLSNASARTLDTYERILSRLAVNLPAGVGIAEIEVEHLILQLAEIPAPSWRLHRAAYNGLFRWAIKYGKRSVQNPVEMLPDLLHQAPTRVYKIFTPGEHAALRAAARFTDDPVRDEARVELLLNAGLRKGEARGLRMGDVNPATRAVVVYGKGGKERLIRIKVDGFWLAWENQLLEPIPSLGRTPLPEDYVWFPMRVAGAYKGRERRVTKSYPDRPMGESSFHGWWKRLIDHAGIPYRKPHMTRHTFATDALDASEGDLYGVSNALGHASTKTTEIYLHSSQKRMDSIADALARVRKADNDLSTEC